MKTFRWLLSGLLLLGNVVHAEGGCPPGLIPSTGTDINSCVPIPPGYYGNQQQKPPQPTSPPPQWADQWMAIATDGTSGSLGTANNISSRSGAERLALADCRAKGGARCKVDVSYGNGCAAMVVGDTGYNVHGAASLDEATKLAIKTCTDATSNCRVYYAACSLPVRIQ